ncbi:AAA family ATPase [Thalassolituus marinus]|uniref:AAA family ATPase n=1 Tax=Thalassolituus marinus TaxID=671053 RepID=A0ABS7ZUG8_9GAMM|nr:AAA family ATPase [Thalassolituus marinus]MCA6065349.1 AAA family ATPase [Thalassolituus marinus]
MCQNLFSAGWSSLVARRAHNPSEGEQKCISLAGFLAELRADNRNSGIVFDDPVNSLDHNWRVRFAKRISQEANQRQVIVLTHDIPFLWMLQKECPDAHVIGLTRGENRTGIPQESPPWNAETTSRRIGKIKNALPKLKKFESLCHEDFAEEAKNLYGKMRETWEQLIEEWLVKGVVERFGREIHPSNIRYLVDISEPDVQTITQAYDRCSTNFTGHSKAIALGAGYVTYEDVERDVKLLEEYFQNLKKRRQ